MTRRASCARFGLTTTMTRCAPISCISLATPSAASPVANRTRWPSVSWMKRMLKLRCEGRGLPLAMSHALAHHRAALLGVLMIVAKTLLHCADQAAVRHAHGWRPRIAYSRLAMVICSSRLARSGRGA